jgi:hypothetical protein
MAAIFGRDFLNFLGPTIVGYDDLSLTPSLRQGAREAFPEKMRLIGRNKYRDQFQSDPLGGSRRLGRLGRSVAFGIAGLSQRCVPSRKEAAIIYRTSEMSRTRGNSPSRHKAATREPDRCRLRRSCLFRARSWTRSRGQYWVDSAGRPAENVRCPV